MQINACIQRWVIFVVLVFGTFAWQTSGTTASQSEIPSRRPSEAVADHGRKAPSRLVTARSPLRAYTREVAVVPNETRRQKKAVRLVPREAPVSIPDSSSVYDSSPLVYAILPDRAPENSGESLLVAQNNDESQKQGASSSQNALNNAEEPNKPLVDTDQTLTKTTLATEKPSNHSTEPRADSTGPSSQLVLSVQTASGAYSTSNISGIESASNLTGNQSTVLITNTREIEVVIIAEGPPEPMPLPLTSTELPLLDGSAAPSRRFPSSSLLYQNGSFVGARRPLPERYPAHHYWAVYLTLTLLTLSVLAICLVCCTPQGRRDMSIPPPKTVQYGQPLPPYSYAFSYDMRQAEAQETARLNPPANP